MTSLPDVDSVVRGSDVHVGGRFLALVEVRLLADQAADPQDDPDDDQTRDEAGNGREEGVADPDDDSAEGLERVLDGCLLYTSDAADEA
mgnify:CR=1 FL=1